MKLQIRVKTKSTSFMTRYVNTLPEADRELASLALQIYTDIALRPEFEKVDLGPGFAKTFQDEINTKCGPDEAGAIYLIVADFHDWLVSQGMAQPNPFV